MSHEIRKMLVLSTSHLTEELLEPGAPPWDGTISYELTYGALLWVPDDPEQHARDEMDQPPIEVVAVQVYARKLGCDYVMFDSDGPEMDDLPSWEW